MATRPRNTNYVSEMPDLGWKMSRDLGIMFQSGKRPEGPCAEHYNTAFTKKASKSLYRIMASIQTRTHWTRKLTRILIASV